MKVIAEIAWTVRAGTSLKRHQVMSKRKDAQKLRTDNRDDDDGNDYREEKRIVSKQVVQAQKYSTLEP